MLFANITKGVAELVLLYLGKKPHEFNISGVKQDPPNKMFNKHFRGYNYNRESFWEKLQKQEDCRKLLEKKKISNFDELEYAVWNWADDLMREDVQKQ